jgi:hypothetical protein
VITYEDVKWRRNQVEDSRFLRDRTAIPKSGTRPAGCVVRQPGHLASGGGRTRWAHSRSMPVNIGPTIPLKRSRNSWNRRLPADLLACTHPSSCPAPSCGRQKSQEITRRVKSGGRTGGRLERRRVGRSRPLKRRLGRAANITLSSRCSMTTGWRNGPALGDGRDRRVDRASRAASPHLRPSG